MSGNKDCKQLKIPLNEHEQYLLQRYIDAEEAIEDFLEKGKSDMFRVEVFFYFYYAGHGCSDQKQHIVLNESDISKVFWPAET